MPFQRRQGNQFRSNRRPSNGQRSRRGPAKKFIHPSRFINKAVAKADEAPYEAEHAFSDFPFGAELYHNIVIEFSTEWKV